MNAFKKEFGEAEPVVRYLFFSRGVSHRNIVELLLTGAFFHAGVHPRRRINTSSVFRCPSAHGRITAGNQAPRVVIVVLLVSLSLAAYWSFLSPSLYLTLAAARTLPFPRSLLHRAPLLCSPCFPNIARLIHTVFVSLSLVSPFFKHGPPTDVGGPLLDNDRPFNA